MRPKTLLALALTAAAPALFQTPPAHAQASSLLQQLGSQVLKQAMDQREPPQDRRTTDTRDASRSGGPRLEIQGGSNFTAGPYTLFQPDFASTPVGAMPPDLATNGSGQVVSVSGIPGRWLELTDNASYKLRNGIRLPDRFTVQFDVLPVVEQINDLNSFSFGFAHDNRPASRIPDAYNAGAINNVAFGYLNGGGGDLTVGSSATRYHNITQLDWRNFANQVGHVDIAVTGDQMQVYLDGRKVVDSKLFERNVVRHFYLSSSFGHRHDAKILVGNLRIAGFEDPANQAAPQNQGQAPNTGER